MRGVFLGLLLAGVSVAADPPPAKPLTDEQKDALAKMAAIDVYIDALNKDGQLAEGVQPAKLYIDTARQAFGNDDPLVDNGWKTLAICHMKAGEMAAAVAAAAERSAIIGRAFGANSWRAIDARLWEQGLRERQRMSAAERAALDRADAQIVESAEHHDAGRLGEAERLGQAAMAAKRDRLGPNHPQVAFAAVNVIAPLSTAGRLEEAEELARWADEVVRQAYGPDHPAVAQTTANLAAILDQQGRYAESERLKRQSLNATRRAYGSFHPDVVIALNNLGSLLSKQGRNAEAEPLVRESLAIRLRVLGPGHSDVLLSQSSLGSLLTDMGRYAEAEPLLRGTLAGREAAFGPGHPATAACLDNLSYWHDRQGQTAAAEPLARRSLDIYRKVFGVANPTTAGAAVSLGEILTRLGRPGDAVPVLREALTVLTAVFEPKHPKVASTMAALATALRDLGQATEARRLAVRAAALAADHLDTSAAGQSEAGQLAHAADRDSLVRLVLTCVPTDAPAEANAAVLRWRGAVTARQTFARAARGIDAGSRTLLVELTAVTRQLVNLANNPPPPEKKIDIPARMKELTEKRSDLEAQLAARSATFGKYVKNRSLTPADLQQSLPAGTALIDYFAYGGKLAAFVVRPDAIARVDLGEAEPVAAAADAFRQQLNRVHPTTGRPDDPAVTLRKRVWEPLGKHLFGAATVLVCPDGPLCRLPFASLPGAGPGKYLVEEVALTVVPVPRLLTDLLADRGPKKDEPPTLLAVGDVDFDAAPAAAETATPAGWKRTRAGGPKTWPRLPGTAGELAELSARFRAAIPGGKLTVLRDRAATDAAVRAEAGRHEYLHLATHGFFADPSADPPLVKRADGPAVGDTPRPAGPHPGLLSGLAFAGANQPRGDDDGVLTALEVGDLDLSRVELAVLSACETGLGAVAGGEGVLGLQRAFQVAGARTTVTTLWQIPDAATQRLMTRFYDNLWAKKMPKLHALRDAQLWMLRSEAADPGLGRGLDRVADAPPVPADGRLPPYYWAAFVLAGDWR